MQKIPHEEGGMHARIAFWTSFLGLGLAPACDADDNPELDRQLERARDATAKYHDVAVAEADGFVSTEECAFDPVFGTMGIHFLHIARGADPALVIEEPEILLYVRQEGELRLVAIEYVQDLLIDGRPYLGCGVENRSCPPANPPPGPSLYDGIAFDGPMPGHALGMPWHRDLHVWLWAPNSAGTFAQFNPTLSCQ